MGGIVRNLHGKVIESKARPDHFHGLFSIPPALAVADAPRVLKANSSLWVHEARRRAAFAWQTGCGAFSVSPSNVPDVVDYIRNQHEHHRKLSFQEESIAFLEGPGISYDERYIWG
jgi:REP element-mobilizing transposase RayT